MKEEERGGKGRGTRRILGKRDQLCKGIQFYVRLTTDTASVRVSTTIDGYDDQ